MEATVTIALSFYDVRVPAAMSQDHTRKGGKGIWMKAADLPNNEQLRLMIGLEPTKLPPSDHKLHISMSVGKQRTLGSCRRPSDEEVEAAKFLYQAARFVEENLGDDPHCRHLWEI